MTTEELRKICEAQGPCKCDECPFDGCESWGQTSQVIDRPNSDRDQTIKADAGKPRLELVPPSLMMAVGAVRTYGVNKYGDSDSWRRVSPDRYLGAMLRHIMAYQAGETIDPESGLPHMWHAACNMAFLIDMDASAYKNDETCPKIDFKTKHEKLSTENKNGNTAHFRAKYGDAP